jgi:hypothetical protein
MKTNIPSHLSDSELVSEVKRFARSEREATAQLVAHLAELDARRLYLGAGFSSLFTYCCEVLRLSEHEAYNRIEAARAARRFPLILDLLGEARLNLTTVRLLAPHLSDDNHEELLAAASGRSKREVEELLARRFPRPEVPSLIRKLPVVRPKPVPTPALTSVTDANALSLDAAGDAQALAPPAPSSAAQPTLLPPPVHRPVVTPIAPERYVIRFTADASTREKLRVAQDMLRHAVPNGDVGEIVDRALTALLEDLARKKYAATERPRASRGAAAGSRHVPARVKRAVWLRDGGRCAFLARDGRRCTERGFLEFHHVTPYGAGGQATLPNIQLRCKGHNAYEADLYYGPRGSVGSDVVHESGRPDPRLTMPATRSGASWSRTAGAATTEPARGCDSGGSAMNRPSRPL